MACEVSNDSCSGPLGHLAVGVPSPTELPPCDYSFRQLFELLGIKNVLRLLTCLLLEHQVLLKSSGEGGLRGRWG